MPVQFTFSYSQGALCPASETFIKFFCVSSKAGFVTKVNLLKALFHFHFRAVGECVLMQQMGKEEVGPKQGSQVQRSRGSVNFGKTGKM